MKVLVTGGAGYIGSHACKALAAAGHEPIAFDNLRYGHRWAVQWGPLFHGDLNSAASLSEAMRTHRPDAVMHFAALTYVGESVEKPHLYYRNNVSGALNLLDAMRDHGVDRFVFSSTCATYGVPSSMPITEETVQAPLSPYGRSKLMIEHVLSDYAAAGEIGAVALRYFNAAGADADGDSGEEHDPETHLIPLILEVAAGKRDRIAIYGTDYDTPDGTCIRDYIHVADLASAHVAALDKAERGQFTAYNLGTGNGFSVREVIDAVRRVTEHDIPVQETERRAGDPPALVADANKAKRELGWTPVYTTLDPIVETAWNWMRSNTRSGLAKT